MASRTTVVLDDEARAAARQLARRCGCSLSEAMRRALIRQRDAELGVPRERRRQRARARRRPFDLLEGSDPAAEIRRLKAEDAGFWICYHLDTDFLVYALSSAGPERRRLRTLAESDAEIQMSALAWYELARGPARPSSSPWPAPFSRRTAPLRTDSLGE